MALTPQQCWTTAGEEHPTDPRARRSRALELLATHGHTITRPVGAGHTGQPGWNSPEATR